MSTVLATSNYHIEEIHQEPQKAINDRDIRRFCALTPYKYSEKLCEATQINFSNSNATWLKIMDGNKMVGTAMLQFVNGWDHVLLQHLLIQPEYRRRGIGTKTVNYIKSRARRVTLSVLGADLVEFYRARGFKMVLTTQDGLMIKFVVEGHLPPSAVTDPDEMKKIKMTAYPRFKALVGGIMDTTTISREEAFNLARRYDM
tara:strand:+ start:422 stop:1024 length:603 start_codon:yes stop_codon:yes gene_type:complete